MLDSLNHQTIGRYHLHVEDVGHTRYFDQRDFALSLLNSHANGRVIFRGLYNAGRPSIHVPGWVDGEFVENDWGNEKHARPLYEGVAERLGALLPAGGRFWIAYEAFGAEGTMMLETRAGLLASLPMVTTPIGFLLFRADCWLGLRDWHFPEGGREGPRKIQGNKSATAEHRRERATEIAPELRKFLDASPHDQLEQRAQARARIILPVMDSILKRDQAGLATKIFTKE